MFRRGGALGRADERWLIVGLGNPGPRYAETWHNCGWLALDELARRHDIAIRRLRFDGLWGEGQIAGQRCVLLKPQTYMNESGRSVAAALRWFRIPHERLIVLYDDVDIARGQLRLRGSGGPGSHRGMQSLVQHLGGGGFVRLRIGIGPQPPQRDIVSFVLEAIPSQLLTVMREAFERSADGVEWLLGRGLEEAMNRLHRGNPKPPRAPRPPRVAAESAEAAEPTAPEAAEPADETETQS